MSLWRIFRDLLPRRPLKVGTVATHNADGTSDVTTLEGGTVRLQGQIVDVGDQAFYEGDRIVGEAPGLPTFEVDV